MYKRKGEKRWGKERGHERKERRHETREREHERKERGHERKVRGHERGGIIKARIGKLATEKSQRFYITIKHSPRLKEPY